MIICFPPYLPQTWILLECKSEFSYHYWKLCIVPKSCPVSPFWKILSCNYSSCGSLFSWYTPFLLSRKLHQRYSKSETFLLWSLPLEHFPPNNRLNNVSHLYSWSLCLYLIFSVRSILNIYNTLCPHPALFHSFYFSFFFFLYFYFYHVIFNG